MKNITSRSFTGALVVLAGVIFLLSNLGVASFSDVIHTWWPLFVVALGVVMVINNPRNYISAFMVFALGALLQLNMLEIITVNVWQIIWPVVIIGIGVTIIADRYKGAAVSGKSRHMTTVLMSGSEEKNNSKDYQGGKVSAVFGGVSLDLRDAVIVKEATLEVLAVCGGLELFVPAGVVVDKQLVHVMGGTEDKTVASSAEQAPVLHIVGTVALGGIEIKN